MIQRAWFALCFAILAVACGGKHDGGNGNSPDASNPCGVFGTPCSTGDTCCSKTCDSTGSCTTTSGPNCAAAGTSCSANTDCCSTSCVGNVCQDKQCVADGSTCAQDGECCGGSCQNNKCTPLNAACKTDGNPCGGNVDCCSSFCNANHTCGPASWCTQDGDSCAHDADCCGGLCQMGATGTLGLCTHPMPGSTNCSAGVDGTVCSDCGGCCSRLCEVYAPTGVKVCQPAEGCRVDGDICRTDTDCCGAAGTGLPGDGNVTCLKQVATDPTGVCRNPISCNPEGDVCQYQNYATCGNSSARNDCCAAPGNSGVCQLDGLGVPRCYGLGTKCRMSGETCSFAGDCCNGLPCVPDGNGILHCGAAACVAMGGMCTATADCCNGASCVFTPGQTYGTCGGGGTCAQDGQSCTQNSNCCNMDCNVSGSNPLMPCNGMPTGCTCFTPIL